MSDHSHPVPGHPAPGAEVPPGSTHGHAVPEQYSPGHHAGHEHHGDHGVKKYVYVFLALCVLTTLSFFTYSDAWPFHDRPAVGWAFMMAVSCSKALLVMLFFMHLKYEADWKYVLTIPASIMSVFLVLALVPDIGLRIGGPDSLYHYSDARLEHVGDLDDQKALEAATIKEYDNAGGRRTGDHAGHGTPGGSTHGGSDHHGASPAAAPSPSAPTTSPTSTRPAP